MRFYSWNPGGDFDASGRPNPNWSVGEVSLPGGLQWWNLKEGRHLDKCEGDIVAEFDENVPPTDFPLTDHLLPIHSQRLRDTIGQLGLSGEVQYLPVQLRGITTGRQIEGYALANYLTVLDCLDRQRSRFQIWTKENLLFWEKREWMLGTFRDIYKCVLDRYQVADRRLFRLWGHSVVVVREDVKTAVEMAGVTGCVFRELPDE